MGNLGNEESNGGRYSSRECASDFWRRACRNGNDNEWPESKRLLVLQGVHLMQARILRPEEWQRINSPGLPELLAYTEPQNIAVVVVENDDKEIVASVCALQVTHFEGLWIKPEERGNAGVFRALIRQAYAIPRSRGEHFVLAAPDEGDARMASTCSRLGGKLLEGDLHVLPIGESKWAS